MKLESSLQKHNAGYPDDW